MRKFLFLLGSACLASPLAAQDDDTGITVTATGIGGTSTPATVSLSVMMLTARGRDREMAEQAGADRFMTKPFSNAEILAEVRAMLDQPRRAG